MSQDGVVKKMFYNDLYIHYTFHFFYGAANHQCKALGLILQCGWEGVNYIQFIIKLLKIPSM